MQEMQEVQVWSLGQEDPLEEEMATHPSILAWNIPRTKEPGMLQSMGSKRLDTAEQLNTHMCIIMGVCVYKIPSIFIPTFLEYKQTASQVFPWIVSALFPTKLILNRGKDRRTLLGALPSPPFLPCPHPVCLTCTFFRAQLCAAASCLRLVSPAS